METKGCLSEGEREFLGGSFSTGASVTSWIREGGEYIYFQENVFQSSSWKKEVGKNGEEGKKVL